MAAISQTRWRLKDYFDLNLIGATHGLSDGFSRMLVPVLALIVVELGLSEFETGLLLSVFSISSFLFLYPLSMLADYTGRKKLILLCGLSLSAVAFIAMRWSIGLGSLMILAFVAGAGNSIYHPCGTALTAERFADRKAVAISYHGLWGNIGLGIVPIVQTSLATVYGWRNAIALCAVPAALLLPLVGIRFPSGQGSAEPKTSRSASQVASGLTQRVLRNRAVVLLAVIYCLNSIGTKGVSSFLPLLATQKFNMDTPTIGIALSLYFGAGIVAKPIMGYIYNQWGARSALSISMLLTGLLVLAIGLTTWQGSLMIFATLIGLVSPISPIILTAAADVSESDMLASAVGFIYTTYALSFVSPLIGGWLAQRFNLEVSYIFFAIVACIGAGVALMLSRGSSDVKQTT